MPKKTLTTLTALGLTLCLLCACGEETQLPAAEDYQLDAETSATARGVGIGDDAKAFASAYDGLMILCTVPETPSDAETDASSDTDTADGQDGPSYQLLPAGAIPCDAVLTMVLPAFFIDGLPVDIDQFCEEHEIEKADFISFISDRSYLASHTVIYRYLVFTWEEGVIADIRSESMYYDPDGLYHEAN